MSEDDTLARMSLSRPGGYYMIEWRVPPGRPPYAYGPLRRITEDQATLGHERERYLLEVRQFMPRDGAAIVRPVICELDEEMAINAGLMTRLVAEAVMACLATVHVSIIGTPQVEFRLVECSYTSRWETRRLPVAVETAREELA